MLTVGSVFEVIEMELKVDASVSAVLFEDEDTGLVELAIDPRNSTYIQLRGSRAA